MQMEWWTYINQTSSGDPSLPHLHLHGSSKATPTPLPAQRWPESRHQAQAGARGGVHPRARPFCCTLSWHPEAQPPGSDAAARSSMMQGDLRTVRCGLHPGLSEHLRWKPTTPTYFLCFSHCIWFCPFTQQHPGRLTGLQHDPQRPSWCSVKPAHFPSRQKGTTKSNGHSQCKVAQGLPVGSTNTKESCGPEPACSRSSVSAEIMTITPPHSQE